MKKLKSLGFAVIYLLIPIVLQLVLSVMISFHIVAVRLLHGVEYDADKLEAWISSAQINMILIMLVNATIIVGVGIWYWYVRKVHQPVEAKDRYRKILAPRAIVTILLLAFASQFVCNILMIVFQNLFPAVYEDYVKLADTMSLKTMAAPAMAVNDEPMVIAPAPNTQSQQAQMKIVIKGKTMPVQTISVNGCTMAPVRAIAEALGFKVT